MGEDEEMHGWRRWTLVSALVVIVVVVGGLFAIHLIQGDGDPPLTLDDATTTTVAGATTVPTTALQSLDGTWKIVSGSTAGYRVKETLFGQSATAVGRTTAVTGEFTLAGTTVSTASFSVDLTQVSSDRSQRDGQFQGRIMNTAQFPTATFALSTPIDLATLPAAGVEIKPKATGRLTVHGTTKTVTVALTAKRAGNTISVLGNIPVTFADYGIDDPSGGPASVSDTGTIEFLLTLSRG
jgi:polyisoprenoid-binding protein YceI